MKLHYSSRKYRELVEWIALNDSPGDNHTKEDVAGYLTTTMLSHCYKLKKEHVADDILQFREIRQED